MRAALSTIQLKFEGLESYRDFLCSSEYNCEELQFFQTCPGHPRYDIRYQFHDPILQPCMVPNPSTFFSLVVRVGCYMHAERSSRANTVINVHIRRKELSTTKTASHPRTLTRNEGEDPSQVMYRNGVKHT